MSITIRHAFAAAQALAKKGCAANSAAGSAMEAEIQCRKVRVSPTAPDHTATDRSITFIAAKPAIPSRSSSARPVGSAAFWICAESRGWPG